MRRRIFISMIPLIGLVLMICACSPTPKPAPGQVTVGVVTLKSRASPVTVTLTGRAVAYRTSEVRPQVGGILVERLFKEGGQVKKGQILYRIDAASYKAALDIAQGQLAKARAAVESAKPKAERYRALAKLDAVSQQDADDAAATLKQDQAAVVAAKASLESARIDLKRTSIRAPISGRIDTSAVTEGALLTADQATAMATINQLNPIYVDVTLSSLQLLKLRREISRGAVKAVNGEVKVALQLGDGSTYSHQGTLSVIGSSVGKGTGAVSLRVIVPNPDYLILPGMYVGAVLSMAVNERAIFAPQQAINRDSKGDASVLVVDGSGKIESLPVETGEMTGNSILITTGLKAGMHVIVEGSQKVRVGQSVKTVTVSGNDQVPTGSAGGDDSGGGSTAGKKAAGG